MRTLAFVGVVSSAATACGGGTIGAPLPGLGNAGADETGDGTWAPMGSSSSPTPSDASDAEGEAGSSGGEAFTTTADGADDLVPGFDEIIELFAGEHLYWVSGDDARSVETTVVLPEAGLGYERIVLDFAVRCPPGGGCDHWARIGRLSIVEDDQEIELARFVTPYRLPASWEVDVTDLRPLLTGEVRLRAFVSTWVGPGSQYGEGWLLDAELRFEGGIPSPEPTFAVPLWPQTKVPVGDPDVPIADFVPAVAVPPLAGATRVGFRALVTGHGQGNADNCAEFCPLTHTITVDDLDYAREIWRDDCNETPLGDQPGTWEYPRAGWCPGTAVEPWSVETEVPTESPLSVTYGIGTYLNACRPGSDDCTQCELGASCEYDGSLHTEAYFLVSAILIGYR